MATCDRAESVRTGRAYEDDHATYWTDDSDTLSSNRQLNIVPLHHALAISVSSASVRPRETPESRKRVPGHTHCVSVQAEAKLKKAVTTHRFASRSCSSYHAGRSSDCSGLPDMLSAMHMWNTVEHLCVVPRDSNGRDTR
eukprot:644941-Amphidinium_carterae.1